MNSLRMFVLDALGNKYLYTCATNREGQAAQFRKHARWWINSGYKQSPTDNWPCMPCQIVIEEYQDETAI